MWEHRTVSNKEYQTTGRVNPNESYGRLMDEVEETVKKAEVEQFAYEAFLDYIPTRGPWEPLPETDNVSEPTKFEKVVKLEPSTVVFPS